MNSPKYTILLASIALLAGCSLGIKTTVTKSYPPLDSTQVVVVLDEHQPIPYGALDLGTVRIYDKGTFKCDSATVFTAAKTEVRKAGGNVLKVVEHSRPGFASSCHQIIGVMLKVEDIHDTALVRAMQTKAPPVPPVKHDVRLAINGGWSRMTAKTPANLNSFEKTYLDELKWGNHYGAEVDYFFKENTALTLQVNSFHSSYSAAATGTMANGTTVSGILSDKISILYIAPGITWRIPSKTKMDAFLFGFSLGYVHYSDEASFDSLSTITGSSVGFSYELGYDIGLSSTTSLGLGVAWKLGTLSSIDVTRGGKTTTYDLDQDHYVGVGRLDFSLGLRFKL